ncbi:hypothetical protein EEL31_17415 [Brevibacillus laterosporus]|uniref:Uncharacterized protein n=1 Tax=Brevibacillus laterosporus TaxID=1465 RepID=A0A518V407_BRELA|nr:hypothetical protein EEL30_04635 [Brevibacillus laterosporus]TPG70088.1 hypothetical protein EEL31_17415 [Brevibacillus laterosporus]
MWSLLTLTIITLLLFAFSLFTKFNFIIFAVSFLFLSRLLDKTIFKNFKRPNKVLSILIVLSFIAINVFVVVDIIR